jgi:hypothetical protein
LTSFDDRQVKAWEEAIGLLAAIGARARSGGDLRVAAAVSVVIADVDGDSLDLKAYRVNGSLMDARHLRSDRRLNALQPYAAAGEQAVGRFEGSAR